MRYLKLLEVLYGAQKIFEGQDIVSAKVLEELDPISAEITVNTFDFKLHTTDAEFSMLNPKGLYSMLQQRQKIQAIGVVGAAEMDMGSFYLSSWENGTENTVTMRAQDAVGLLESATYYGGMYTDIPASDLIADILDSAGADHDIDPEFASVLLSGYLPISSHREALHQAAFAAGAVVDCSRGEKIRVYPAPERPSVKIGRERKFQGQKLKLRELVTGVTVTAPI